MRVLGGRQAGAGGGGLELPHKRELEEAELISEGKVQPRPMLQQGCSCSFPTWLRPGMPVSENSPGRLAEL